MSFMLPNYLTPRIDELLFSVVARHCWLLSKIGHSRALRLLFGSEQVYGPIELMTQVASLNRVLGEPHDSDRLIWEHTLFPAFAPFLPAPRAAAAQSAMLGESAKAVRAGIIRGNVRPHSHFQFCPICAHAEQQQTGEAYWHRLPQLAGIFVCPTHRVFLEQSDLARSVNGGSINFVAAESLPQVSVRPIEDGNREHATLLRLACNAENVLGNRFNAPGTDQLQSKYFARAIELGYATNSGVILWKRLIPAFRNKYPEPLLRAIQCGLPVMAPKCRDHWLAEILRSAGAPQATIRHLLLFDFFDLTPAQVFNSTPIAPASSRQEEILCDDAPGQDNTSESKGCRKGVGGHWKLQRAGRLESRRKEWLQLRANFPDASTDELYRKSPSCYGFLYTHARTWLKENSPQSRRRPPSGLKSKIIELDQGIAERIPQAREELLKGTGKLKRVSEFGLLSKLGVFSRVKNKLNQMPLVREALELNIESKVEFAVRKIKRKAALMREQNVGISKTSLLCKAYVTADLRLHPDIIKTVEVELLVSNFKPEEQLAA